MKTNGSLRKKLHRTLHLGQAWRLVWRSGRALTIANVVILVVQGVLPLLVLYLMKLVVDAVATGLAVSDQEIDFGKVAFLIGLMGAVALVGALLRSIAELVSEMQAQTLTDHVDDILHAKSIEVDLEYYENSQYYDTLHRAQQEAPYRPWSIVRGLVGVGQNGIPLLAIAGLLFSFHWSIAAILFVVAIPGGLLRVKYSGKLFRWKRAQTPLERQAWYFRWILTRDQHAKEIRLFDLGSLFMNRYRDVRKQLRRERFKLVAKRSAAEFVTQASITLAVLGSYIFIAYRTVQGTITVGDLVMYFQAFQRGQGYLRETMRNLTGLYEDNLFLSSLNEFLNLKPKVIEPVHPKPVPRPMQTGIAFDHVNFQYPTGTRRVLEDINLTIRPGEVVALVGENGSGKTTLVKLLCRLYDPTDGVITLDNVDLRQFVTAALRREIGIVFQDYAHYNLTARENIWFGDLELSPNDERIIAAAQHSGASEVITNLPYGYETILGKWFENGEELSIGEWQKIALARAFLRDTQIIVLDEPTSAMDAKAEYEVFQKFRQLAAGRTAIIISHRFSTVKMADRIHVLEGGRIIESGPHDELVRRRGTYSRLYETQAQYYK